MPTVFSSNQYLQSSIEKLIKVLQGSGAFIHPDLQVRVDDGGISISLAQNLKNQPLIILKEEHLVDINMFDIWVEDGRIAYNKKPDVNVSDVQLSLLENLMVIYNESKRWAHFENSFLILKNNNSIAQTCYELLLSARNPNNNKSQKPLTKFSPKVLASLFLSTRTFGYQMSGQGKIKQVLIPLVELLNHAWDGSVFEVKNLEDDYSLTVRVKQVVGSHASANECFAFYGPMDALDSYLEYGFVDASAPVVRSIPLTIEIKNLGLLEFESKSIHMFGKRLDGNLRGLNKHMPEFSADKNEKVLHASHIFIPSEHSPFSMRKILLAMVNEMMGQEKLLINPEPFVLAIEDEILEKNLVFYRDLKRQASLLQENNGTNIPEIILLHQIIDIQLSKIENYVRLKQKF